MQGQGGPCMAHPIFAIHCNFACDLSQFCGSASGEGGQGQGLSTRLTRIGMVLMSKMDEAVHHSLNFKLRFDSRYCLCQSQ